MVFGSKAAQTPSEGSQQSSSNADIAVAHVGGLGAGHHRERYRS